MKDTSRTAALDYLLAIGNLIALADHKEEQIMNLIEERNNLSSVTSDPEELEKLATAIQEEIVLASRDRENLYQDRKTLQRNFFSRYNIDMDYWCQFKHYAIALTAMEECRNADPTADNQFILNRFRKEVYQFLGQAMWVWPANCWRCLADMLDEKPLDIPVDPAEVTSPFSSDTWDEYPHVQTPEERSEELDAAWEVTPWPGWEIAQIFDPKDYSGSEINYIDANVVIPADCGWHLEYREWDWWKIFRCAVKDVPPVEDTWFKAKRRIK